MMRVLLDNLVVCAFLRYRDGRCARVGGQPHPRGTGGRDARRHRRDDASLGDRGPAQHGALQLAGSAWSPLADVTRLLAERRKTGAERSIVGGSARNRFPGIVTRIEKDRVAAVVEILAGPHRIVSLMTAEAVEEMGLKVGDEAVGVVKATTVIVEIPSSKESKA